MNKVLALLLSALFILSFTACSSDTGDDTVDTTDADTTAVTTEDLGYDIPEVVDYEGYEYRIGINDNRNTDIRILFTESSNGDIINDAVFDRNRNISERYNINIIGIPDNDNAIHNKVANNVLAGDDIYDIVAVPARSHFMIAQQGLLLNVNTLDSLYLDAPWWDPAIIDGYSIDGKNYTVIGDISTSDDVMALTVLFNSKLYNDFGLEDPYSIVSDGRWTFDTFWEMAKTGSYDIDGDGEMTAYDRYGFITEADAWYYFSTGAGFDPIERSSSGGIVYAFDNEKAFNILNKTKQLYLNPRITLIAQNAEVKAPHSSVWQMVEAMFMQNQGLFKSGTFIDVINMRNMEIDYGVLPIPKYDEAQDNYRNLVSALVEAMTFPITISDIDRTMTITDALAYESMISISPLFYEVFLDEKLVRDESSKAMLDIVLDTKLYDLDYTAEISTLSQKMSSMVISHTDDFASTWASIKDSSNAKLEKFVEAFEG